METEAEVRELAMKILNSAGTHEVELLLKGVHGIKAALEFMVERVDWDYENEKISDEQAAQFYDLLGVPHNLSPGE